MGWRDRVLQRIDECGYRTRNELCHKAGLSAGSLNMALAGTHDLKMATIEKLAVALNTTSKWILFGDEIVEARRVPLFRSGVEVSNFLEDATKEVQSVNYEMVEVGASLRVSKYAFAWEHWTMDMEPVFRSGDILIVEPVEEYSKKRTGATTYILVGKKRKGAPGSELYGCCFVRKLSYIADKAYFESTQPNLYSPIQWDNSLLFRDDSRDTTDLVGVVVQRITTFHNPEILP